MNTDTEEYASQDEEYSLPPVEALLAGTLALMTGYAQRGEGCEIRPLMASKLVRNLTALAHHPAVSPAMQAMLARLVKHWLRAADPLGSGQAGAPAWVHAVPAAVQ
jgi:hypothetical protein